LPHTYANLKKDVRGVATLWNNHTITVKTLKSLIKTIAWEHGISYHKAMILVGKEINKD
jgi:hypothetical protein